MRSSSLLALAAAALVSCAQERADSAPRPAAVEPARGYGSRDTPVVIRGEGFRLEPYQHAAGRPGVDATFRAWLGATELADVQWVSAAELRGRVPAGIPPGVHRLEIADPRGARGALEAAFTTVPGAPPALHVTAALQPAVASLGQPVLLHVEIRNGGDVPAHGVLLEATVRGEALAMPAPPAAAAALAPGEAVAFDVAASAAALGTASVEVAASANDPVTGEALRSATVDAGAVFVQPHSALSSALTVSPARASVGQLVAAEVVFANAPGAAPVEGLATSLTGAVGAGAVEVVTPAARCDVPSGGTCTATFLLRAAAPGEVILHVDASGVDANSGEAVAAPHASGSIEVQRPPALAASLAASPARVNVGQPVALALSISNHGDVAALGVAPALVAAPPGSERVGAAPAAQDVPAGATRTFAWTVVLREPGTAAFAAAASGADANGAGPVSLPSTLSNDVGVDSPAALVATAAAAPPRVSAGQTVAVVLDVTNVGEAGAEVTPSLSATASGTATWRADPAEPAALAGGATARFAWSVETSGSGTLAFTASVAGVDANSGAPVAATAPAGAVAVQAPARLAVVASAAPAVANEGQVVAVRVDVTNAGEAAAAEVVPALAAAGAAAHAGGATPATPLRLAGGATQRFEWTYAAGSAPGAASFTASASGRDENSGAALAAGPAEAGSVKVQRAAALTVEITSAPVRVNAQQRFTVRLRVRNDGDSAATGVLPVLACEGCIAGPLPAAVSLAAGEWAELAQDLAATLPGAVTLRARASGTDAVDGLVRSSPEQTVPLDVQRDAQLVALASVDATQVSAGQPFGLVLEVTNVGGAAANLAPSLSAAATGSAGWTAATSDGAVRLAGGATATFRWTVTPSGSGALVLHPRVDGTDENDLDPIAASDAAGEVRVQAPARLAVAIDAPAVVNGGQIFTVAVEVENGGEAAANGVSPSLTLIAGATYVAGPLPAPPVRLAGGARSRFEWRYAAGPAPTTLQLDAGASGSDGNADTPLSASAERRDVVVQRAAALATSIASAPARVNRSQVFSVRVRVRNDGDSGASAVATVVECDACQPGEAPGAVDLPGGASAEVERSFTAGGVGPAVLRASASGTDVVELAVRAAPEVSAPLSIEEPAVLAAAFHEPGVAPMIGFAVDLDVSNARADPARAQADAALVEPGALSVVEGTGFLTAAEVSCAARDVAPRTIVAGGTASFGWTCTATRAGQVKLSVAVAGADANDGAPLGAAAIGVLQVDEAAEIAADPFSDGTAFSFVFAYAGHVFLGPSGDGRGVVRCTPDGSACASFGFSFTRDTTDWGSTSKNVPPFGCAAEITTLGAAGWCDPNNPQSTACFCGPDLESGRGILASFRLGAAQDEWLVAMGRAKKAGDLNYAYMTRDTATPLAFSYVDLYASMPENANIENVTSIAVLDDRLYFGLQSEAVDRPRLVVLTRTPTAPGLDATPSDTFAMTFQGTAMGESGGGTWPISQVDALLGFEGRLFVANRKAVLVSKTGAPPGSPNAALDFDDCTPQPPATWEATGIARYPTKQDVTPRDKGVTALVAWQGRLYLSRNTLASVPELWTFTPRRDPQTGAFLGCAADRSDWRRVATNFGDPASTHATALFASDAYLYYGLDDAVSGVKLYRTAAAAPVVESDFVGRAGCLAPCEPLGRAGFGAATNARFFDARALAFGAVDEVWATVGDGAGAVRVYRVAE